MFLYLLTAIFALLAIAEMVVILKSRKKHWHLLSEKQVIYSVAEPFDLREIHQSEMFRKVFYVRAVLCVMFMFFALLSFGLSFAF